MATRSKQERRREARRMQEQQSLMKKAERLGVSVESLRKPKHKAKNKWDR